MKEMNREMELNKEELEQVSGGWRFCLGVGISSEPSAAACAVIGASTNGRSYGEGYAACVYVGLGAGFDVEEKYFEPDEDTKERRKYSS